MEQAKLLCQMAATTWRPAVALTLLSIVYIAGFWLPVAWTDPAMLKDNDYQMLARHMTLFAVGSFSWMIAIVLVEVLLIAMKPLRRSGLVAAGHADPFGRVTIGLGLVISFVLAANWIVQFGNTLPDGKLTGTWSIIVPALSMTGGTAMMIFLARLAGHYLPGMGPWFLFAIGDLSLLYERIGGKFEAYAAGAVSGTGVLSSFAATFAVLALCCWLVALLRKTAHAKLISPVYALFVAFTLGSYAATLLLLFSAKTSGWTMFVTEHWALFIILSQALLLAITAIIYGRRQMLAPVMLAMTAALLLGLVIDKWGSSLIEITTAMILAIIVQPVASAIGSHRSLPRISPARDRG